MSLLSDATPLRNLERAASAEPRRLRYVDALREAFEQEMASDERVFLFGLDIDDHKGIQGSTLDLKQRFGSERVLATPLSEDAMTGVAIGAAMAGLRPIHVHIRMDFLMLCMNQLINVAAKSHYMYGGTVQVPLVVRSMIGKSWGQGAQHSQGLHSMFMHVPGLKVVAPSNAYDAKGCMIAAIRDPNPVIFVEHRLLYETRAEVPAAPYEVPFGTARVLREGDAITLVGVSNMVTEALEAHEHLQDVGIDAEVIDPISLAPLDIETILTSVRRTGRLIVVDNGWTNCGASAEIVARLVERDVTFSARRLGYAPTTCPATPSLERAFYADARTIAKTAHAMVRPMAPPLECEPAEVTSPDVPPFRGPF